jgi:hypothetical protein
MDEQKAEAVVTRLRDRGVMAHVEHLGVYQVAVRVVLPDGREAMWDPEGTTAIGAEILLDGDLVGFIEPTGGDTELDVDTIVGIIARADYGPPL